MTLFTTNQTHGRQALYRAAMTGLAEAAREVTEQGTFNYLDRNTLDVNKFME